MMTTTKLSILGILTLIAGCAVESTPIPEPEKSPSGGEGFDTAPATQASACADAAKLVYVVSRQSDLYSFAPDKLTFTKIGRMSCPSGLPSSMAVDRAGTAWVSFKNGRLGKVSTTDASCTETAFAPNQLGFNKFGMAFSATTGGEEGLFVAGISTAGRETVAGMGLGSIDLASLSVAAIGDYSGSLAKSAAELTSTGDGKLYGFFFTTPSATLAEIDAATGQTKNPRVLDGVNVGQAFAFSSWGGDFWFYTSEGTPPNVKPSKVTRLDTRTDTLSVTMPDVGFSIAGAGVSTCAPTKDLR